MWFFGTCKTPSSYRTIDIGDTLVNALKEYKAEQEANKKEYGDYYMMHYAKTVKNTYTNKDEIKIINAYKEIDVGLPTVAFVFVKNNGIYEGTDTCKYPFRVIHYELGIPCRFHDFRDTHATRLIEAGADIKAVSKRLGHSTIETTYNIYVRVTTKMVEEAEKYQKERNKIMADNRDLHKQVDNIKAEYQQKEDNLKWKYEYRINKLEKENGYLHKVIDKFRETIHKFIEWICVNFDMGTGDTLIRDFERETRTCLDGEEQIKREDREKDLEMER